MLHGGFQTRPQKCLCASQSLKTLIKIGDEVIYVLKADLKTHGLAIPVAILPLIYGARSINIILHKQAFKATPGETHGMQLHAIQHGIDSCL